jgi:antitoxin (DNA-binding transcriptional repressor) of toxin-antitoxin stability system
MGRLRVGTLLKYFNIWHISSMTTITLAKAQADLPALIDRVLAGEEIFIATPGAAAVKLSPVVAEEAVFDEATALLRGYGSMKRQLVVGPEFFEPLSDEECGYGPDDKAGT